MQSAAVYKRPMKRWMIYGLVFWAGLWCGALYGVAAVKSFDKLDLKR